MRLNYKQLGQYIEPVNIRNKDLSVETLLGVSIQKCFMPSIANTVGTDMSKYKVVKRNQFAYGPVTSRNGDKISVALLEDFDSAIISQAYVVFQVIDQDQLDPEYLMMWFRRPEFDRYARFMSHGSARETFDWEEMCEVELPVPSIEKQREIVKEYNTIVNRIKLNEQLNQKLEETAQALYKHWFVDFEFPNEKGQPYKSSGGEMVYNEELDQEIPKDFEIYYLGDLIESHSKKHNFKKEKLIFFNTSDILNGDFLHSKYSDVSSMPGQAKKSIAKDDILFSEIRPANKRFALVRINADDYVVSTKLMVLRLKSSIVGHLRIYQYLTNPKFIRKLHQAAEGRSGTFPQITFEEHLEKHPIIISTKVLENKFYSVLESTYERMFATRDENRILTELKQVLLSKMSKVESSTEKVI